MVERCEACERGDCWDCSLHSRCQCECEGCAYEPAVIVSLPAGVTEGNGWRIIKKETD